MRKIREVLRLKFEVGLSARQISTSLHVGRATVGDYLNRFAASGLSWPSAFTDGELQRRLFPPAPTVPSDQRPMPDWPWALCFGRNIGSVSRLREDATCSNAGGTEKRGQVQPS
jgi:hypothetical protein